jgi:hypothetical protein
MTPQQLARDHCANWRNDGKGCLGAIIDDDLQIRRCCPKPRCLLTSPVQRCLYFEECVMPLARSIENPLQRQLFEEAVRQYRLAANLPRAQTRLCPACRRSMEPRRRFCPVCAAARRKASNRHSVKKHRLACKQLGQFRPLLSNGLQAPSARVGKESPASMPAP